MGMICGDDDTIGGLRFTALKKGRVYKGCEVVVLQKVDGGTGPDVCLIKLSDGTYTVCGSRHTPNGNWAVQGYGLRKFDKSVLGALIKLGAITKDAVSAHVESEKARKEKSEKHYARIALGKACETLGIPVPEQAQS